MFTVSNTSNHESKLLKANEVAKRLAVCRSKAYQMMMRGDIPTVRFGSSVRVRACDLEEFIQKSWSGWK